MGNSFSTTTASGASTMSITTAREWVRQFARNAGDSSVYTDADIDRAIQFAGSEWCRRTLNYRVTGTITLTADDRDLPAFPAYFRPDKLIRAWIEYTETSQGNNLQVIDAQVAGTNPTATGVPTAIAFTSPTSGIVWPTPDAAYDISLEFFREFETWTAAGTTTFGLPLEDMFPIVQLGAPAILQSNEPEHAFTTVAWKRFEEAIARGVRLTLGPACTQLDSYVPAPTIEEERELT